MPVPISTDHPIRELFTALVERSLRGELTSPDPAVPRYLADVLVEFTHRDNLYRLSDAFGRRLRVVLARRSTPEEKVNIAKGHAPFCIAMQPSRSDERRASQRSSHSAASP